MSRVGLAPIAIPSGVEVKVKDGSVEVSGPGGKLSRTPHPLIGVEVSDGSVIVSRKGDSAGEKALHGLFRSLINNMVVGVSRGFEKTLDMRGIGYRAELKGKALVLNVGFSHPVELQVPEGIKVEILKKPTFEQLAVTHMVIRGVDKELVGQFSAVVRRVCPPEPYKGKGIRYLDEYVRRKAGKKAA